MERGPQPEGVNSSERGARLFVVDTLKAIAEIRHSTANNLRRIEDSRRVASERIAKGDADEETIERAQGQINDADEHSAKVVITRDEAIKRTKTEASARIKALVGEGPLCARLCAYIEAEDLSPIVVQATGVQESKTNGEIKIIDAVAGHANPEDRATVRRMMEELGIEGDRSLTE